jgi:hypothetical protein
VLLVEGEVLTEPAGQLLPDVVRFLTVIRLADGAWRALTVTRSTGLAMAKVGRRGRAEV